uniref:Uncharacterized protein n=1 Tax=Picea glauca TaxID=3330 RepID=A0A101LUE7_PICGL|nr:hypothetical protein ABT39_MTgene2385 [Picea glauca]QHR88987.1 hypothetical protein Q903MT_gene3006 [Picea sitchensis]
MIRTTLTLRPTLPNYPYLMTLALGPRPSALPYYLEPPKSPPYCLGNSPGKYDQFHHER